MFSDVTSCCTKDLLGSKEIIRFVIIIDVRVAQIHQDASRNVSYIFAGNPPKMYVYILAGPPMKLGLHFWRLGNQ